MRHIQTFLASKALEWVVNVIILAYAVVLAAESFVTYGTGLEVLVTTEKILLVILCIEVGVRVVFAFSSWLTERSLSNQNELRSGWFYFDVVTTILGFIPGFESFRAYRLLRLIGRFEVFRHPVELLLRALKKSFSIAVIGGILVSVNGLMATQAFGDAMPAEFGRVDRAILSSLFVVFFDDLGNQYLTMYALNPVPALVHGLFTLLVGVLVITLFITTVLDARDQLKKEQEKEA
jgi:hypothetical protein